MELPPHIASDDMLPKRTLVSPETAAASPSKPLAKRALKSALASERLAVIRRKNLAGLDTKTRSLNRSFDFYAADELSTGL
uniref:Uncharacterized protein n=1 Tax=Bradyrhizobium ottawaense TaxID=931866 RepID=A0A2U8P177_9BRAD|nr:hypothetical protein CIT37_03395 [Bradyrhizobium ottawaense]